MTVSTQGLDARRESDRITVTLDGQVFGVFLFEADRAKPIVWPLVGPDGIGLTRDWPMNEDNPDDSRDHVHQQSFYVAHGDVNGVDYWSLAAGHGTQRVREVQLTRTPANVTIDALIDWLDAAGRRQLTERRQLVFWNQTAGLRSLDLTSRLEMTDGPVRFGDTKEGGMCSIRVASGLEEKRGGGTITNGAGGRGEAACWGKPAPWCDYSGTLSGKRLGIAILDHPRNFRHPTTWHVRAYGLMTANPFGLSYFTNDKTKDGSYTWRQNEAVEYRYRVILHSGDAAAAGLAAKWNQWSGR
jgi:hypothetical protein